MRTTRKLLACIGFLAILGLTACVEEQSAQLLPKPGKPAALAADANDLLFCFWNVENLFDDKDDDRNSTDEIFDNPFAENAEFRQRKYERLAEALMRLNRGRGPDIIACVEVESVRAAELLRDALNQRVKDDALKYRSIAMKNLDAGRHIAPCVISRHPLSQQSTRLHGKLLRVLETKLILHGHELTIIASHWTSQIRKDDGSAGDSGRSNYARTIAAAYEGILRRNPEADVIVCGDFNDTPEAAPIANTLRASLDRHAVQQSAASPKPLMLNLMAGKDPAKYGTLWYNNEPLIYDHICISPGLLDDKGWTAAPASVLAVTEGLIRPGGTRRQPWRFGDPQNNFRLDQRGYSDHFPVTVRISVTP